MRKSSTVTTGVPSCSGKLCVSAYSYFEMTGCSRFIAKFGLKDGCAYWRTLFPSEILRLCKGKGMEYERDQARLRYLMDMVPTDDEGESHDSDDDSEGEIDMVEERDGGSESEQEISDCEEEEEDDTIVAIAASFLGKDKKTIWMKHVPPKNVRTRSENIVKRLPISKLPTRCLQTPKDIFQFFIDDAMIAILVENTNLYIQSISSKYARYRDARPTDTIEMRALLGLLLYAGVMKSSRLNVGELWKSDGSIIEILRLGMSIKRFLFLLRCLRFDNKDTREERTAIDKLAPIRNFFDLFVTKCKDGYSLSEYVTIDEKLEGFRGKCNFRQYIPTKPNRYGIKIFALSDAKTFYTGNLEVYVGQQPAGPYAVSNSPGDVVMRLCDEIKGSGRNVTMDNWFTSVPLVDTLLKNFKLTVIGTMRKNKGELPLEFSKPTHPVGASMFGFTRNSIVCFIPKKKKNVLLISSLHHDDNIDIQSGKPEIILDYNATKGGVDTVDRLCANYNVARNTRRWPMVVFYSVLNVTGINSFVVYCSNSPNPNLKRRKFLQRLAMDLIRPHLVVRATILNIPRTLRVSGTNTAPGNTVTPPEGQIGRCRMLMH
nr:uncharacterized protein LOC111504426 [Leptinotarsa decemlineata]